LPAAVVGVVEVVDVVIAVDVGAGAGAGAVFNVGSIDIFFLFLSLFRIFFILGYKKNLFERAAAAR
jgi:hypothetical protein